MSFLFVFFSDFRFNLNLQSNIVKLTDELCISRCHLNWNWVNFFLWNCQIFFLLWQILSFKCLFFFRFESFNRIVPLYLWFQFQFSEFSRWKLWNFVVILLSFVFYCFQFVDLLLQHRLTSFPSTVFHGFCWVEMKRSFWSFFFFRWKCSTEEKHVFAFKKKRCSVFAKEIFLLENHHAWRIVRNKIVTMRFSLLSIKFLSFIRNGDEKTSIGLFTWREQTNIFSQSNEVGESFSSVNKYFTEQSCREDSQRKSFQWNALSNDQQFSSWQKTKLTSLRIKFHLRWFVVRLGWKVVNVNQSFDFIRWTKWKIFFSKTHRSMKKFVVYSLVKRAQWSRNWKNQNVYWVTVFKSMSSPIVQHFAFRSMSCFNSFIDSFPIWLPKRSSALSVCEKKSICVEEEKIRLTLFSRNASARCSAPLSPIWLSLRFSVLSVCVKKSICVFCAEEEKIRLTLFSRNASDSSFAPWAPIRFHSRWSLLSICVKKSICVEEKKIRLTLFS